MCVCAGDCHCESWGHGTKCQGAGVVEGIILFLFLVTFQLHCNVAYFWDPLYSYSTLISHHKGLHSLHCGCNGAETRGIGKK